MHNILFISHSLALLLLLLPHLTILFEPGSRQIIRKNRICQLHPDYPLIWMFLYIRATSRYMHNEVRLFFPLFCFAFFLSRCISFVVVAIKKQNAKHATHANSYMEKRVHVACDCIYDLSILLC